MAQWSIKKSQFRKENYEECRAEAFRILRRCADEWAKGNPEEPPIEEALDHVLKPFIDFRFLNRPT